MTKKIIALLLFLALMLSACGTVKSPEVESQAKSTRPVVAERVTAAEVAHIHSASLRVSRSHARAEAHRIARKKARIAAHKAAVRAARLKAARKAREARQARERKTYHQATSHHVSHVSLAGIAACIAKYESGGNPTAQNPSSSASGLFQFVDGTWNNYGGYSRAMYAPASVQLAKFYQVWDNGRGAHNWVTAYKCGY